MTRAKTFFLVSTQIYDHIHNNTPSHIPSSSNFIHQLHYGKLIACAIIFDGFSEI